METKLWWQSRTLWVNVITLLLLVLSDVQGIIANPDGVKLIAEAVVILNIILRVITHTKLIWEEPSDKPME